MTVLTSVLKVFVPLFLSCVWTYMSLREERDKDRLFFPVLKPSLAIILAGIAVWQALALPS